MLWLFATAGLGTDSEMQMLSAVTESPAPEYPRHSFLFLTSFCRRRQQRLAKDGVVALQRFKQRCLESEGHCGWYFYFAILRKLLWPYWHDGAIMFTLPTDYFWLSKLTFWAACFDTAFYILALSAQAFIWNDFSNSWQWHLKFCLSLRSLWKTRHLQRVKYPWVWSRLGVLSTAPWPLADLWSHWSNASLEQFEWTRSNDMWKLLELPEAPQACASAQGSFSALQATASAPGSFGVSLQATASEPESCGSCREPGSCSIQAQACAPGSFDVSLK